MIQLTESSLHNLISTHFDREVARTKTLSTGQVHVAFVDGTMAIYSPEEIEKWAEDAIMGEEYEREMEYEMGLLRKYYLNALKFP